MDSLIRFDNVQRDMHAGITNEDELNGSERDDSYDSYDSYISCISWMHCILGSGM